MANAATAQTAIPVAFNSSVSFRKIVPVIVTFDTTASDLTIYTPNAANYAAIIGMIYEEASAHTLTFKSGSTTLVTLERTAYSGIGKGIGTGDGIMIMGAKGEALKLNCGTAAISTMMVYCAEFPSLLISA